MIYREMSRKDLIKLRDAEKGTPLNKRHDFHWIVDKKTGEVARCRVGTWRDVPEALRLSTTTMILAVLPDNEEEDLDQVIMEVDPELWLGGPNAKNNFRVEDEEDDATDELDRLGYVERIRRVVDEKVFDQCVVDGLSFCMIAEHEDARLVFDECEAFIGDFELMLFPIEWHPPIYAYTWETKI